MRLFQSLILSTVLASASASAQVTSCPGGRAPDAPPPQTPELLAPPHAAEWQEAAVTTLPLLNVAPLQAEDAVNANARGVPLRVGVDRAARLPIDSADAMDWRVDAAGGWVWRRKFIDQGAQAVRVWFSNVSLGPGVRLLVADANASLVHEITNTKPGELAWSPALPGDTVLIELRSNVLPPPGNPAAVVEGVSHIYDRSFGPWPADQPLPEGACNVSVACRSVDSNARDSVGRMLFSSGGTQFKCSGTTLNDLDPSGFRLWFLTANHCLSTQAEVNSLTVYWFYQPSSCGGSAPSLFSRPQNVGGTLLVTNPTTDVTFIELAGAVPAGLGFAGWTTAAVSGTVRGIHHPGGGPKEFSEGQLQGGLNCGSFHSVRWSDGTTEGGSSGSPLFNGSWQVVGQLSGACCPPSHSLPGMPCELSDCGNRNDWRDVYGPFDQEFAQLAPFISGPGVWVDLAYNGSENGSQSQPFNTLAEGIAAAPCGGRVILVGNRSAPQVGAYSRPANCPVTIISFGGPTTLR